MADYRISIDDGAYLATAYEHHPSLDAACAAARRTAVSMLMDLGGPTGGSLMCEVFAPFVGDVRYFEVAVIVTDHIDSFESGRDGTRLPAWLSPSDRETQAGIV